MSRRTRTDTLGELMKRRRKELTLTLAQVGQELELSNGNFVGMVERGERMPSDQRLLRIAEVLDLDERRLLALKYEETAGSAVPRLLRPPDPELPRLRQLLLDTCDNAAEMRAEFERGERPALERVVLGALFEYVLVPALTNDRWAPKRLRRRVSAWQKRRRADPTVELDPWWFEEEAEELVSWAREQYRSWEFTLPTLTLRIRHSDSPTDVSTLPLVPSELREQMLRSVQRTETAAPTLEDLLAAEGLSRDDVEEILAMVELKKARKKRSRRGA